MRTIFSPFRAVLLCCAWIGAYSAQGHARQAAGEAHGAILWRLPAVATLDASDPLTKPPAYRGFVLSVSGNTVTVKDTPWTAGAYTTPSAPHVVRLTSGRQKGRLFRILQNTTSSLILDSTLLALNTSGLQVEAGDRLEVIPVDTLGSRFGRTAAALLLQGGAAEQSADLVQVWNGASWDSYYFSLATVPARWAPAANPSADANDLPLYPDTALRITRRATAKQLVLNGRVPPVRSFFRASEGTTALLGAPFPVKLPTAELVIGGPATWTRSAASSTADKLQIKNGAGYLTLFQDAAGIWRNVTAPAAALTGVAIQPSTLLYVQNIGAASSAPWFTIAPPYPDQVGPVFTPTVQPPPIPPAQSPPSLRVTSGSNVKTKSSSKKVRGVASSSQSQIRQVEYRRHPSKSYRRASGSTSWSFVAKLRPGKNIFYVRSIDKRGLASAPKRVVIRRK